MWPDWGRILIQLSHIWLSYWVCSWVCAAHYIWFILHLYTNYVIRESQAKTSVHPIKKGRAKRGKAALESWGQAKDMWNNVYEVTIVVSTATSASYVLVTWGVPPGRLDLGNYRLRLRVRRRHRLDLWDPRLRAGSRTDSGTDSAKKYTSRSHTIVAHPCDKYLDV